MNTAFTMSCLLAGVMAIQVQLDAANESLITLAQKPTFASY